jgi:cytochrome c5
MAAAQDASKIDHGRLVYERVCIACHTPDNVMVSSPKAGDAAEWKRRVEARPAGLDGLVHNAINGFGAMPAKGAHPELTERDIRDAVLYMMAPPAGTRAP